MSCSLPVALQAGPEAQQQEAAAQLQQLGAVAAQAVACQWEPAPAVEAAGEEAAAAAAAAAAQRPSQWARGAALQWPESWCGSGAGVAVAGPGAPAPASGAAALSRWQTLLPAAPSGLPSVALWGAQALQAAAVLLSALQMAAASLLLTSGGRLSGGAAPQSLRLCLCLTAVSSSLLGALLCREGAPQEQAQAAEALL